MKIISWALAAQWNPWKVARIGATLASVAIVFLTADAVCAAQHPLDPLSADEITQTIALLKAAGKVSDSSEFPLLVLREPPKAEVLAFHSGDPIRREAFTVIYERASGKTFEAVVDLTGKSIASWEEIRGVQPSIMVKDIQIAYQAAFSDPRFAEAMKKRGIANLQDVTLDAWSAGWYGPSAEDGHRVLAMVPYYQGKLSNYYARPIENVVVRVDLNLGKVISFVDSGVVPIATAPADFAAGTAGTAPGESVQTAGANFVVDGNEVRWHNWHFRFTVDEREGLVLQTVGYQDGVRLRPILYRGSVSEMFVPYADPGTAWYFRNVFDEGEVGLGWLTDSLEPGTDVPSNSRFFDAIIADQQGHPRVIPRAAALYERDGGLLWKHLDLATQRNVSRRARELVLSYITTISNYDYGFEWIFHEDGTLEMEAQLTGLMIPKGVATNADATYSRMVANQVAAVEHQHFFNFRLDMDVDGGSNSILEMNTTAVPPDSKAPRTRAFVTRETMLMTELQAQRRLNAATDRSWMVINPGVKNSLGEAVGYELMPEGNAVPYVAADSWAGRRAGFLNEQLWVTPYDPTEMHAAGDYPNQRKGDDGLPMWTAANRSIENRDIVLWYTVGMTHVPRPEDWPVVPVHRVGFMLVPVGFFSRNPTIDVPAGPAAP
jgi:primary-amine oxidase